MEDAAEDAEEVTRLLQSFRKLHGGASYTSVLGKPTFTGVVARAGSWEHSREEVRGRWWGSTGDQGGQEKSRALVPGHRSCVIEEKEEKFLCKNIYGTETSCLTPIVAEGQSRRRIEFEASLCYISFLRPA